MLGLHLNIKPKDILVSLERALEHLVGTYEDSMVDTKHKRLAAFGQKFGLQIITDVESSSGTVSFQKPHPLQLNIMAELLESEFSIYTPEIVKASRVQRVVICNNLSCGEQNAAGAAQMGLFVVDSLLFDTNRITRNWKNARMTIHHEVFHSIDYHDDFMNYVDLHWNHLNSPGFRYDPLNLHDKRVPKGFLSAYSTTATWEDKAELYSHMIVEYSSVMKQCARDEVLALKVIRMKELLHNACSDFDEEFWCTIAERSRLQANKFSQWEKAKQLYHQSDEMLSDEENSLLTPILVTSKKDEGRRVWVASMCTPAGEPFGQSVSFRTFNRLNSFLMEIEVPEHRRKERIKDDVVFRARVSEETLRKVGLIE